jgi:DNA-binding PadR family transcriptional regulator
MGRGGRGRRGAFPGPPPVPDFTQFNPWGFGPGHPGGRQRARRGLLRESILVLLKEQPRNGYQIITTLNERTLGLWSPSPGAVYPCLQQLTDEGLIEPTEVEGQKVFKLTEAGEKAAEDAPKEPWGSEQPEFRAGEWPVVEIRGLFEELKSLAKALRVMATDATPEQLKTISDDIAALKRKIYATLAQEPDDED